MLSLPLAPEHGARLLVAAMRMLAFDPDQARDDQGQWTSGGGGSAFIKQHVEGRAIIDRARAQADRAPMGDTPESQDQQRLADAQTNVLAHPDMVLGLGQHSAESTRYVAAFGEEHKAAPLPDDVERGTPKECYKNASLLVLEHTELDYAEGFAKSDRTGELTFMHAWGVTKDGAVVDPTWDNPEKGKYFGVRYERSKYLQYLYKAKVYGVLGSTTKNMKQAIETGGRKLRALGIRALGGPGSGNFGHAGRPGEVGGSGPGDSVMPVANTAQTLLTQQGGIDSLRQFTQPDGTLTPERLALHERIIEEQLAKHSQQEIPASAMMGGGGASGKTTLVTNLMGGGGASGKSVMQAELSIPKDSVHVDVDIIRTKLPEWDTELSLATAEGRKVHEQLGQFTHEEASMISKQVIDRAIGRQNNLLVDGAGDSGIDKLEANVARYKQGGREIVANYVTVDYETAYARMRARGDETGRYIPAAHLKAVHADVSRTFPQAVERGLFDKFTLWDTNGSKPLGGGRFSAPLKVASGRGREMVVHDQAAYDRFLAKGRP